MPVNDLMTVSEKKRKKCKVENAIERTRIEREDEEEEEYDEL